MNGNFEVDKSAYPYQGITYGSNVRVSYVPTLRVLSVSLPRVVADAVALRMNVLHHTGKLSTTDAAQSVHGITREELRAAVDRGDIYGDVYSQVIGTLDSQGSEAAR